MTKFDVCHLLARLHSPPLDTSNLIPINDGPGPGETIRPRDCWMSNVSACVRSHCRAIHGAHPRFTQSEIEALGINTATVDFEQWWRDWLAKETKA